MFRTHEGDTIREAIIEEDIQRIIAKYSDAGYPLAKVITESIVPRDSNKLDMTFRIEEGIQPRVVAMNVTGLTSTDTNISLFSEEYRRSAKQSQPSRYIFFCRRDATY
jgi:outer membrane protein assembly factor BamA